MQERLTPFAEQDAKEREIMPSNIRSFIWKQHARNYIF